MLTYVENNNFDKMKYDNQEKILQLLKFLSNNDKNYQNKLLKLTVYIGNFL